MNLLSHGCGSNLLEHIEEVCSAAQNLEERIICACHDVGKASTLWQVYIKNDDPHSPHKHAAVGGMLASLLIRNLGRDSALVWSLTALHVSAAHHSFLGAVMNYKKEFQIISEDPQVKTFFCKSIATLLPEVESNLFERVWEQFKEIVPCTIRSQQAYISEYKKVSGDDKLKAYLLARSILGRLCFQDNQSAAKQSGNSDRIALWSNVYPSKEFSQRPAKIYPESDLKIHTLRNELKSHFHSCLNIDSQFYFIDAPTGLGKTETMLSAAEIVRERNNLVRIIFSVPQVSIADQIYEDYFGDKENAQIWNYIRQEKKYTKSSSEENTIDNTSAEFNLDVALQPFSESYNITTFNQVLLAMCHPLRTRCIRGIGLRDAVIIMDEFHKLPLTVLPYFFRIAREYSQLQNCRFILGSATPLDKYEYLGLENSQSILTQFTKFLYEDPIINDRRLYRTIGYIDIETLAEKIEVFHDESDQNLMVVLNLISKGTWPLLQHFAGTYNPWKQIEDLESNDTSRIIIFLDGLVPPVLRRKIILKCKKVMRNRPVTLITTQMVEVGVDLDFDRAFVDYQGLAPKLFIFFKKKITTHGFEVVFFVFVVILFVCIEITTNKRKPAMSFIVKQPRGNGHVHLFLAESYRVENKPYPVQKRTYLGVLDSASSELLLARNANEPSPEVIKLLQCKGISFSGRRFSRKERKQALLDKTIKSSSCLEIGRIALLEHLALKSGLLASLNASFNAEDARRIFAAAAYECCEGGALCRLQDWADDASLREEAMALSAPSVTRLCQSIGANLSNRNDFFRAWFKASGKPKALVSDTTSISSYAEKLSLVEWGYNRDKEELPQVNLNMVYSRETHTPLYYRLIFGSVPDVCTLTATSKIISELGLKTYNFSLDRGFFSIENLLHFHDSKLGYTIGAPMGNNKEAERLFERNKQKLRSFKSAVVYDNVTLHHVSDTYRIVKKGKRDERTRVVKTTAHIYLNKCRRAQQEKELVELLHGIMKEFSRHTFTELEEAETWLETMAGRSKKCLFNVRKTREKAKNPGERYAASADGEFQIGVAERAYVSAVKHFGAFMILNSDPSADGEQTLRDNRSRECQEKVFDILKNSTGNDRLRASGDASVEGRLFIAFVAVTLHKLLENKLRQGECLGAVTVNKALDLMRKIRIGVFADGARIPYEIPLKVRKLLENIAPELLESITGKKPAVRRRSEKL